MKNPQPALPRDDASASGERPAPPRTVTSQGPRYAPITDDDAEVRTSIDAMPAGARVAVRPISPAEARRLAALHETDDDEPPTVVRSHTRPPPVRPHRTQFVAEVGLASAPLPKDPYAVRTPRGTQIVNQPAPARPLAPPPPSVERTTLYAAPPAAAAPAPPPAAALQAAPPPAPRPPAAPVLERVVSVRVETLAAVGAALLLLSSIAWLLHVLRHA